MKLATIDNGAGPSVAVLQDDGSLVELWHVDPEVPEDVGSLLSLGAPAVDNLVRKADTVTDRLRPEDVTFRPLVTRPHAVWCAALNYPNHVTEGNWERPSFPPFFLRVADSLCGHLEPMVQPSVSDRLDYEGELAVVIGKTARHVSEADAYDVIAGYSCFNDGSVRDWQRHTQQITSGKNFTATGGFGPWLTTKDEVPDIESAELSLRLNGRTMQRTKIGEMIFGIPQQIAYLSTMCELRPGDVVVTGTPGGVGARQDPPLFMQPGDVVEVEITGIGLLNNPIVKEGDHS